MLLKKGGKNAILNILFNININLSQILPWIEKYCNIEILLKQDLEKMKEMGSLRSVRTISAISRLVIHYKDNEKILKLIESILEGCDIFKKLDEETEILLWNFERTFLASIFFYSKVREKISISNHDEKLKVRS